MRTGITAPWLKTLAILFLILLAAPRALFAASSVRLLIEKRDGGSLDTTRSPYLPVDSASVSAAGFVLVADYTSFTLFEGPASGADSLIAALAAEGYFARAVPELDRIELLRRTIDVDGGISMSPYDSMEGPASTTARGLYLLALRGYPTQIWLDDLERRGVNLIEPLPPAAILVEGSRAVVEALPGSASFIRRAFRMTSPMKTEPMNDFPPDSGSPYRPVAIDAYERSTADSIEPFLRSVAEGDSLATISRDGPRVQYAANLADVDIATLSRFESVYSVSPIGAAAPSSERQGMLVALPHISPTGVITLPTMVEQGNYTNYIKVVKGISDFGNTKVAMLDTGFDDPAFGIHPDFLCTTGIPNCPSGTSSVIRSFGATNFNQTMEPNVDNMSHGTISASVVTGWPPAGMRLDSGSYRYGLGLAPTVITAMDKFFSASNTYDSQNANILTRLTNALTALGPWGPNIVNHSWNGGGSPINFCGYENTSQYLDKHTRTANVLHVVAAGNNDEATCPYVRSPATAKNAIAVGATENFTLGPTSGWVNHSGFVSNHDPRDDYVGTCADDYFPATQDARNISGFSAKKYSSSLSKPDVVAPGLRVTGPVSRNTSWEVCNPPPQPPPPDGTCNGVFCNKAIATYTFRYGFSAGTSFAAPAVTGTATVLRKWFRNQTGVDPSPAMTKAMVIGGAIDIVGGRIRGVTSDGYNNPNDPMIGPIQDPYQGFGFVSMARLLDSFSNHLYKDQSTVLSPAVTVWTSNPLIVTSTKRTRFTLVWTDRFSTMIGNPNGQIYKNVNDLTLKVCKLNMSTCWYGNVWAGAVSQPIPNGQSVTKDTINNVEYVIVPENTFVNGEQILVRVEVNLLQGDGIDPNGTTLRQDFALFGTNAH